MTAGLARTPEPPGLPLVGHLLPLARDPTGFCARLVAEHGPCVAFRVAGWQARRQRMQPTSHRAQFGAVMRGADRPLFATLFAFLNLRGLDALYEWGRVDYVVVRARRA